MHRLMKLSVRQNLTGWVFVAPAAALIFIFNFYPIVRAFLLSLQTGVGVNLQYAGWVNYQRLFSDSLFRTALGNVLTFLVIQVPIMLMLALILASAAQQPQP